MNIANRLKLAAGVKMVVVAGIVALLLFSTQRVQREFHKQEAATRIHDAVISIRYLTFEYVIWHQERTRRQWELQRDSLSKLLTADAGFTNPEEVVVLADLRRANQHLDTLFGELVGSRQPSANDVPDPALMAELELRLTGQIVTRVQVMLSQARGLAQRSQAAVLAAQRWSDLAVAGLSALVMVLIAATLALVHHSVTRPLARLREGTAAVGAGNLAFRLDVNTRDEFGELARAFDAMTAKLGTTTVSRDELRQANEGLQAEIGVRQLAEQKVEAQLGSLNLLHEITRAIGERQDLQSIFQVVVRSVEDQVRVDFGCICLHDKAHDLLTVASVGQRSAALAHELRMTERERLQVDAKGWAQCLGGQLLHEPDLGRLATPFAQRLAGAGLRSLVLAPMLVEGRMFGVLLAARRQAHAFSSSECEFLLQLAEHVALASHQAQLFAALQRAYDDLRRTQQAVMQQERLRALGEMASGVAHDINNAISPVALYTESLLENEPGLSERARRYVQIIQRAIEDVAQTVTRMRDFYRQREPGLSLAPLQLNQLVQQVMDLTRARWSDLPQQRGCVIEVQTQLAPALPIVMGIESEIREALTNLVFNAVDAMPDGGTLTLRTRLAEKPAADADRPPSQHAVVELVDTGVGMDEATRRRCLEPFFTTKGEQGTGLGLAVVYGVVERHSAELEIDSVRGRGTTVGLSFSVPAAIASEPVADAAGDTPGRALRILLVDDDPVLLQSLFDALRGDGHDVDGANGGQAGIERFGAARASGQPFEVVISDLGMPHVDGRRVASAVKAMSPATPVILLTGWGQRLVSDGDIPAQVDSVLAKPPRMRELRAALARCCKAPSDDVLASG